MSTVPFRYFQKPVMLKRFYTPSYTNTRYRKKYRKRRFYRRRKFTPYLKLRTGSPELKFSNQSGNDTFSAAGAIIDVLQPAQGDNNNQRIGNEIRVFKVNLNISVSYGAADSIVKILFFRWRYATLDLPTVANVLESADVLSYLNVEYCNNCKVLMHRVTNITSDFDIKLFKFRKSYKYGVKYQFLTDLGNSAEFWSYHILFLTDAGADQPTYRYNFRARFTDK